MLATFVALTKSGHAYIPIDSHSALERVSAIVEVAKPSLIITISDFPLEQTSTPMLNLKQVHEAFAQASSYEMTHPVKGDDNYYIIFTSGTTGKPKGVQISHDNLLSFTNWMITDKEFATPSRPQMLAQPPYSICHVLGANLGTGWHAFRSSFSHYSGFQKTLCDNFFIANRYLDLNTVLCRYGHVVRRL